VTATTAHSAVSRTGSCARRPWPGPSSWPRAPTFAHAVTKRLLRYALDHGSRQADRYLLDVAPDLLESRDMQYAVDLLLTQGARKFIQNQAEVIFEGR